MLDVFKKSAKIKVLMQYSLMLLILCQSLPTLAAPTGNNENSEIAVQLQLQKRVRYGEVALVTLGSLAWITADSLRLSSHESLQDIGPTLGHYAAGTFFVFYGLDNLLLKPELQLTRLVGRVATLSGFAMMAFSESELLNLIGAWSLVVGYWLPVVPVFLCPPSEGMKIWKRQTKFIHKVQLVVVPFVVATGIAISAMADTVDFVRTEQEKDEDAGPGKFIAATGSYLFGVGALMTAFFLLDALRHPLKDASSIRALNVFIPPTSFSKRTGGGTGGSPGSGSPRGGTFGGGSIGGGLEVVVN